MIYFNSTSGTIKFLVKDVLKYPLAHYNYSPEIFYWLSIYNSVTKNTKIVKLQESSPFIDQYNQDPNVIYTRCWEVDWIEFSVIGTTIDLEDLENSKIFLEDITGRCQSTLSWGSSNTDLNEIFSVDLFIEPTDFNNRDYYTEAPSYKTYNG